MNTPIECLIDVKELSRRTTLQHSAIYERIKAGDFRPIKLGRKTVFAEGEVQKWINERISGKPEAS